MEIYLTRHGEKEKEKENPKLTRKGIIQTNYLGKRLKNEKFDKIYSSELKRSKETCEILCKYLQQTATEEKSLNEFRLDTIKKEKESWTKKETESIKALKKFIDKITNERTEGKTILIVAHGVTNRIILSHLIDLPMENLVRLEQKETNLSSFYWSNNFGNWRVKYWNDFTHLN
jgi:probable phosphoglycerate mutase